MPTDVTSFNERTLVFTLLCLLWRGTALYGCPETGGLNSLGLNIYRSKTFW